MANKPTRSLGMSTKLDNGAYINFGSFATWSDDKWQWSLRVEGLKELVRLIDNGGIIVKNGYIGGNCSEFGQVKSVQMELPNISKTNKNNVNSDDIPF